MILEYSSTSFGDILIKHSSELDGSPCILYILGKKSSTTSIHSDLIFNEKKHAR